MATESILQTKVPRVAGAGSAAMALGAETSLFQFEGNPSHGAVPPTTYRNPGQATPGGVRQLDPTAGKQKWLTSLTAAAGGAGKLSLYDRLLDISGLSGTVVGAQNINGGSPATLSRHYTDSSGDVDIGNEIFLEVYTAIGGNALNVTCVYSNEFGVSQTTRSIALPAVSRGAQRIARLPLAAGDRGVRDVTSVSFDNSSGVTGNFGLVVAHRLLELELGVLAQPEVWSGVDGQFKEIMTDACPAWTYLAFANVTTVPLVAFMTFAEV